MVRPATPTTRCHARAPARIGAGEAAEAAVQQVVADTGADFVPLL